MLAEFYAAIGTPAPAPGIERLAFLALEVSYSSLRDEWERDLLSDDAISALTSALETSGGASYEETALKALRALQEALRRD